VVAVGGDGTVNEVANGLLLGGGTCALGVIPAGRGSDFARTLRVSRNVAEAITAFGKRTARRVDVGRVDYADGTSRFFVNAAGLGFDGTVAEIATATRLPGSTLPYLHGVIGAILRYRNVPVTIEADGRRATGRACSVIVSNTPFVGGGMKLAPSADIADGLLDLAVLGDLTKLDLIRNVPKVYRGTHVDDPKFTHSLVRRVRIETTSPILVQLDGELAGHPPVTFSVEPGALTVMT
jgi:YegS/Rv2252/BmrU family lipid kinase